MSAPVRSRFPDPASAPADAPLARGGDLEPETLLDAYSQGIFPWPTGRRLWWWSPDPRAVIDVGQLHVSRSLRRTLRRGDLQTSLDTDFEGVVAGCIDRREGTWITGAMRRAYQRLHELGFAHSVEVRNGSGGLVGGIYGVTIGAAFMGESMFSRVDDASKVALVGLHERMAGGGFHFLDAQLPTPHLATLGARAVPRPVFLRRLQEAVRTPATLT